MSDKHLTSEMLDELEKMQNPFNEPDPVLTPEQVQTIRDCAEKRGRVLPHMVDWLADSHEALRADAAAAWQQAKEEHEDCDKTFQQLREGRETWAATLRDAGAEIARLRGTIGALTPAEWQKIARLTEYGHEEAACDRLAEIVKEGDEC